MPRPPKKQATSYKEINWNSPTANALGNAFIAAEGKLPASSIKSSFNKTLFQQARSLGYIKKCEGDLYKATDKLKSEFSGKNTKYGGSGAGIKHTTEVGKIVSLIPKEALTRGNYQNGESLKKQNAEFKGTNKFKERRKDLRRELRNRADENEKRYNEVKDDNTKTNKEKALAYSSYVSEKRRCEKEFEVIEDRKHSFSAPDLQVSLLKTEAKEFIDSMRSRAEEIDNYKIRAEYESTIDRMEAKISTSTTPIITYNIEIISSSYRERDIISKEHWGYAHNTDVFMFSC